MRLAYLLALLLALPAAAQQPIPADAYRDERARELLALVRARRATVDTRITSYETTARERMSIRGGVAGIEKLLMRRETAAGIHWTRDTVRIEVLGAREAMPIVSPGARLPLPGVASAATILAFDPVTSDMLLRLDSTDIRNPLGEGSEANYRYASGDTTSIRLPGGRVVRLVELRVTARRLDPQLINGSFWMDAETHAVVRAAFRLSRPFSSAAGGVWALAPEVGGDLDHVAIDYGLHDLRWWLPRTVVARGVGRVGAVRFPIEYERSYDDYRVVGDTLSSTPPPPAGATAAVPAAPCRPRVSMSIGIYNAPGNDEAAKVAVWDSAFTRIAAALARDSMASDTVVAEGSTRPPPARCDRAFLVTRAPGDLVDTPALSGDVYDDEGVVDDAAIRALADLIGAIPEGPWSLARPSVQLLTPELVRLNRVEGLSVGARVGLSLGPAGASVEARVGTTGEIGARLSGAYTTPLLRAEAAGYRGLEAVDVAAHPFSLGSSLSALVLGRDDNDYFRASGAELRIAPNPARTQRWDLRLFAERQEPVRARSDLTLRGLYDSGFDFRPNLAAEPVSQTGATLRLRGALGDDPGRVRARGELELHGETGDRSFTRPLLRLGVDGGLPGRFGYALSVAAGSAFGELPVQRAWQIGGAGTVRGHDAAAMHGESLWLARAELNRGVPLARISLFADAGWAGDRGRLLDARPLRGAGVGLSFLDDLLRVEVARGIDGGGTRFYLRVGGGF